MKAWTLMGPLLMLLVSTRVFAVEEMGDIDLDPGHAGPHHWVVFLARPVTLTPQSPGHAFVLFGWEDEQAKQTRFEAWGFNPEGHVKSGFTSVQGKIDDEWKTGSLAQQTILLRVQVTSALFDKARAVATSWKAKPGQYQVLTQNNCNTFVLQVAQAIGLHSSEGPNSTFPVNFIRSITK